MDRACSVAALVAAQTAEFILADAIARFQAALTRAARRHRSRDGGLRKHKRGDVELGPGPCMKPAEWIFGGHAEHASAQPAAPPRRQGPTARLTLPGERPEERREGKAGVRTVSLRWSTYT